MRGARSFAELALLRPLLTLPVEREFGSPQDVRRGLLAAGGLVVVAIALVGVVSMLGDYEADMRRIVGNLRPGWLLAGTALMTSGMVALAARWRAFFPPGLQAGLPALTSILLVGGLLNYALPGPAGEVVGAAMAGRRFGMSTERALAAGIAARFTGLGLAGLVAIGLSESGALALPPSLDPWIRAATVGIGGLAVILLVLAWFPGVWKAIARATTGRIARLHRLHAAVERFVDALASLADVGAGAWMRGAGWALVGHALVASGVAVVARSLALSPAPAGLAFTYAASTAGAIVLFAFPGGQVGWDGTFASLLVATAGLDFPSAMALTLLVRMQQLFLVLLGALALIRSLRDGTRPLGG